MPAFFISPFYELIGGGGDSRISAACQVYLSFITREDMWEEFVKRSQFVFTDATDRDLDTKLSLVNFTKMQVGGGPPLTPSP